MDAVLLELGLPALQLGQLAKGHLQHMRLIRRLGGSGDLIDAFLEDVEGVVAAGGIVP